MNSTRRIICSDEGGYVVVETVGAFVPFVLLVISILTLVNIVAVQARVHYALTQATNTISMYCYTLEVLGIADDLATNAKIADNVASEANAMKNDINSVLTGIGSMSDASSALDSGGNIINRAYGWGEEAVGDPKAVLEMLLNYGVKELKDKLFEELARPLVGRYLANGSMTGDEYLTGAGVVNKKTGQSGLGALEFYQIGNLGMGNSTLIDKDGNVKMVAEYEILYTFGGLPLPFNPTLKVTQTVVTKAWLNGSGKGYDG